MRAQKSASRQLVPLSDFEGRLSNKVYSSLKNAIYSLEYPPGEKLRKREICDALGVSRAPVSEAVAMLANEGLVRVIPQSGTFISLLSIGDIREGAFMREALELAAIEKVANIVTGDQLELLDENLYLQQTLINDQDVLGFFRADAAFHRLIFTFTGFKNLSRLAEHSWVQVDRARHLHLPTPGRVQETLVEHRQIAEAIAAHDPALARELTSFHLGQLIKYLEPLERKRPELFEPTGFWHPE